MTDRDGMPSSMTERSCRVAVGQACTHAPHDTHSESMNDSPAPADTFESKPRPSMVNANVPWISSQARTQREQTMHLDGSKSKYGLLWSFTASRWFSPSSPYLTGRSPTAPAMSCNSQSPLAEQVRQSSGWSE